MLASDYAMICFISYAVSTTYLHEEKGKKPQLKIVMTVHLCHFCDLLYDSLLFVGAYLHEEKGTSHNLESYLTSPLSAFRVFSCIFLLYVVHIASCNHCIKT